MGRNNPIKYSDFFDFTDRQVIQQAIQDMKDLESEFVRFKDTIGSFSGKKYDQQLDALTAAIKGVGAATDKLNISNTESQRKLIDNLKIIEQLRKEIDTLKASRKAEAQVVQAVSDSVDGLNQKLKAQVAEYNKLSKANDTVKMAQLAADIRATRNEIQGLTAATRTSASAVQAAAGSYNALDAETKKLIRDLKAMEGGMGSNSSKAREMQKTIETNTKKLSEFDDRMGMSYRQVGQYGNGFKSLGGSILSTIGLLVGINSAFEALNFSIDINKQFNALETALKNVSKGQFEFGKNTQFVRRVVDENGLAILDTTKTYTQFYAATTNSNIGAEQTRKIYEQVSRVAAQLQLSQDQVNNVFLAFGQIASKGKVQTEELRGQIGERIPGAFSVAAKAIGVTQVQLNKMLQQGELMSADFLPKFADELERTFASNGPRHIQTLQASVNRFSNELALLVKSEGLTGFFQNITDIGTNVLHFFNQLSKSTEDLTTEYEDLKQQTEQTTETLTGLVNKYDVLTEKQVRSAEEQNSLNDTVQQVAAIVPGAVTAWNEYGQAIDINKGKVNEFIEAQNNLVKASYQTAKNSIDEQLAKALPRINEINKVIAAGYFKTDRKTGQFVAAKSDEPDAQPVYDKSGAFTKGNFLTQGGEDFKNQLQDRIKLLQDLDKQAFRLNLDLPKQAQGILQAYGGVQYEANKVMRGIQSGISVLENQITEKQLQARQALTKNSREQATFEVNTLIRERDAKRKELNDLKNPKVDPAPPLDTSAADAKAAKRAAADAAKRQREFEQNIREREKIVEEAAQLEDKQNQLQVIRGTISEIEYQQKKIDIVRRSVAARIKLEEQLGSKADQSRIAKFNQELIDAEIQQAKFLADQQAKRKELADKAFKDALKAKEESIKKEKELEEKRLKDFAETQERQFQIRADSLRKQFDYEQARYGKNFAREVDYLNKIIRERKRAGQETEKDEQELALKIADFNHQLQQGLTQLAVDAVQTAFDIIRQNVSAESEANIQRLEDQRDYELELAGSNAAAKKTIDNRYRKEIAAEKRKAAAADKDAALFQVGINTAVSVGKTIAEWGFPFAIPFIAMAVIEGALQAALIAAKPLPKYWQGRGRTGKAETAEVNERGFELIEDDRGRMRVEAKGARTVTRLAGGDVVHTHERSKVILRELIENKEQRNYLESMREGVTVVNRAEQEKEDRIIRQLASGSLNPELLFQAFSRALSNQPYAVKEFNAPFFDEYTVKQGERIKSMNNRNKLGSNG